MHGLGAGEEISWLHLPHAKIELMSDEAIEKLLRRAAKGDAEAQAHVDAWIAEALGPTIATAPLEPPATTGVIFGYDQLDCCCGGTAVIS